jgi:hypothetical protein
MCWIPKTRPQTERDAFRKMENIFVRLVQFEFMKIRIKEWKKIRKPINEKDENSCSEIKLSILMANVPRSNVTINTLTSFLKNGTWLCLHKETPLLLS